MTFLENRVGPSKPITLPRSCSRVLSKLRKLPIEEGLAMANDAYHEAQKPAQRYFAMRLRLRLLQDALETPPKEEKDEVILQVDDIIDIVAEPVIEEPIVEEPEAEPPEPTMMKMNLEDNSLSLMMSALSSSSDDDDDDL